MDKTIEIDPWSTSPLLEYIWQMEDINGFQFEDIIQN